jgi:hypothetical protein
MLNSDEPGFEPKAAVVRTGLSHSRDSAAAVHELVEQIHSPGMSVAVLFCSSEYDLDLLGRELHSAFDCPVLCCTTSGEVGPAGYAEHAMTGFSITSPRLKVFPYCIEGLSLFDPSALASLAVDAKLQMAATCERIPGAKAFGFLLIDGMSVMEEQVVSNLFATLDGLPIVGGSAGDDLQFKRTHVYYDGRFISDAATFALFVTSLPFEIFKTQHFVPTTCKMVATGADPATRTVTSINGRNAADEYARLVGVSADDLTPAVFSANPVMIKIGGEYYVRALQRANPDRSLSFYCAIDQGVVLTLGSGVNLLDNLETVLTAVQQRVDSSVIIGCECVLRRLEVVQHGITESVGKIMARHNVIGFHTYGEQINSVHVNQTFTGVAIGK